MKFFAGMAKPAQKNDKIERKVTESKDSSLNELNSYTV